MKSEKFTLTKHIRFGRFIKMSMLSALLTIWYSGLQAQVTSCPLACNNLVQVSMDEDCIVEITADMMLEGQGLSPSCNYVVEVLGANGVPLAPPSGINPNTSLAYVGNYWVTCANVGQTLTVRVRLGANSCWGTVKIEDKLAPVVTCFPDVTVGCYEDLSTYLTKSTTNRLIAATGLPSASSTVHAISVTIPNDHQYSEVLRSMSVLVNGGTTGLTVTLSKVGLQVPNPRSTTASGSSYNALFDDNILRNTYQGTWTVNITSGVAIPINSLSITYSTLNFINHPYYVNENCNTTTCPSPPIFELISDVIHDGTCGVSEPRAIRTIRYRYKDKYGNLSQICEHDIVFSPITISSLICPYNYDGIGDNFNHLNCNGTFINELDLVEKWDLNNNGYPDVIETGAPYVDGVNSGIGILGNNSICKINTTFSDTRIDICPQSFKVLRVWTILDWCTGQIRNCNQIIKVIDDEGPVLTEKPKVPSPFCNSGAGDVLNADPYSCTATWIVDFSKIVIKITDCDPNPKPNFYVKFKKSPNSNDPVNCNLDPFPELPFVSSDPNTSVEGTPGVITGANAYRIIGLPLGRTWVRFYVVDACGNVTTTTTEIDVVDRTPPVAVCDEFTVVTLSNNGQARVFAHTFDDGSHDNCTEVGFQVSRMTAGCGTRDDVSTVNPTNPANQTLPGRYVQFCCDDLSRQEVDGNRDGVINALDRGYIQVILTVWDDANQDGFFGPPTNTGFPNPNYPDNSNTCMVIIKVEDKVPPVITCPINVTINCGADTSSLVLGRPVYSATPLSTPYFTDNCPNPSMTWKNTGTIDNCGQGVITRTFTVTDNGGRTTTCSQTITVRNTTPYDGPVRNLTTGVWKNLDNKEVNGCMNIDTDPSKTGVPELGNGPCSQVAYTYEDQLFPFVEGVCFKILRKWTVIDWCRFAPNRDINGDLYPTSPTANINIWTYTQIIKVSETVKPVIAISSKADTDAFGDNCTGVVDLKNSATDCTPSAQLKWSYVIRLENASGTIFRTGITNDASGTFPVGTYHIKWTVEDLCGNQSTVDYIFRVLDKKKPTPYCISELTTVVMPTTGSISIWAKDFDKGSSDNCPGKLWFTFDGARPVASKLTIEHYFKGNGLNATQAEYEAGTAQLWRPLDCSSAKWYTCDELGQNTENMSVWDASGNTDYCTVTLNVQANGTACSGARVAGNVGTEKNQMIKDVQITLENMDSNETRSNMTNTLGHFEFIGMSGNVSYRITPEKDDDHLNGVSTLDLVMIQRHILQIDKFNSAYKYIAADVNKDNKVTAADLVELRKLILGIYIELPNNKSWRFLDKAINISDIANPWGVNEYIGINNFTTSMMENNFTGVKVGDINGSAVTNFNGASTENRSKTLTFVAEDQSFQAGQNVKMDITADNFTNMSGAQWTFNFDQTSMEFQGVSSGAIQMNNENVNVLQANNGKLAFSWNDFKGVTIDKDKVLFTIEFRATANNTLTNTVKFSSDITKAEAYTHDLSEINLGLTFRNDNTSDAVFALDQNNPNPFTATTSIGFTLPSAGEAKLTIYDITGKVLKTITNTYPKGRSEVNIASEEINAQGVMFYELESNGLKATKKMIYLNK